MAGKRFFVQVMDIDREQLLGLTGKSLHLFLELAKRFRSGSRDVCVSQLAREFRSDRKAVRKWLRLISEAGLIEFGGAWEIVSAPGLASQRDESKQGGAESTHQVGGKSPRHEGGGVLGPQMVGAQNPTLPCKDRARPGGMNRKEGGARARTRESNVCQGEASPPASLESSSPAQKPQSTPDPIEDLVFPDGNKAPYWQLDNALAEEVGIHRCDPDVRRDLADLWDSHPDEALLRKVARECLNNLNGSISRRRFLASNIVEAWGPEICLAKKAAKQAALRPRKFVPPSKPQTDREIRDAIEAAMVRNRVRSVAQ